MADILKQGVTTTTSTKNHTGLDDDSRSLIDRLIKAPVAVGEDAEKYISAATGIVESPFEERRKKLATGYEGITKSKEDLKKDTELQELIDLAVKGVVKAYAGYKGMKSGLDLSQTTIETPDRSAAYARGLETIRSKEDELGMEERDLNKVMQAREQRFGEFARGKEREADKAWQVSQEKKSYQQRLTEKAADKADKAKEETKSKYAATLSMVNSEYLESKKDLDNAIKGLSFIKESGTDKDLAEGTPAIKKILDANGVDPALRDKYLDSPSSYEAQITEQFQIYNNTVGYLNKERQKIYTSLKDSGTPMTPEVLNRVVLLNNLQDTPELKAAIKSRQKAGLLTYQVGRPVELTNPADKEQLLREKAAGLAKLEAGGLTKERKSQLNSQVLRLNKLITAWDSPEVATKLLEEQGANAPIIWTTTTKDDIFSVEAINDVTSQVLSTGKKYRTIGIGTGE